MCAVALTSVAQNTNVATKNSNAKKVAIYVRNDSGKSELDDKTKSLEFSLSSRINNVGFSVINHDLVVRNLNDYLNDPNSKYRSKAAELKKALQDESLGSKLFDDASSLRLSELIGADYIISVSFASLGNEKKSFSGYGIKTTNISYILRGNYNLYEGGIGAGTAGGAVTAEKVVRQTENLKVEDDDILNELIDSIASQMTTLLEQQNKSNKIAAKENVDGKITINFVIENMSLPEIVKKDDKYVISTNTIPATISSVNADIDGITQTIGTTISLSKGIHMFKIRQKDIIDVEKTINVTGEKNQVITFSLQLTEEARKRWKNDMMFIEEMKDRAKMSEERRIITEAEAQRIRGIGKMYEQSGFKVDAKNLPDIKQSQSIFSN